MSKVEKISITEIDGQKILVTRYSSKKQAKSKCKLRGHQTSDMNIVYQWHRQYPKFGA